MEIKSAAEILKEHVDKSSDDESDIECLTNAMKEYAAQFIELAANNISINLVFDSGHTYEVILKESILKLKEQIK